MSKKEEVEEMELDEYEEFEAHKLKNIEYDKGDVTKQTTTTEGCISFSYGGVDYDIAVDITESYDKRNGTSDVDIDYIDDTPDELYEIWDELCEEFEDYIRGRK